MSDRTLSPSNQHSPTTAMAPTRKAASSLPARKDPAISAPVAFYLFAAANLFSALYAPIQDCDEVYNYWEPTHYLRHGHGFQTWEYSPEYSIRSWFYICLHAVIGLASSLVVKTKQAEFYFIRGGLAVACAFCQARLFSSVSRALDSRVAIIFLVVVWSSPGMFHASTAYLPSSFAMYCNMLAMSSLLEWKSGSNLNNGVFWFGTGGIVGWPFSAALLAPFVAEESILASITGDFGALFRQIFHGAYKCLVVLVVQVGVDAFFYRKFVLVPWNIVKYNIFSGQGRGPNVFGTEPVDFYLRNLLLNFHIWFFLAALAGPLLALQFLASSKTVSGLVLIRSFSFTIPFYMWLAIFSAQPHKEERFMYPMYPFLALNASLALHGILHWFGNTAKTSLPGKLPVWLKFLLVGPILLLSIQAGFLRIVGTITNYRAPLQIFDMRSLNPTNRPHSSDTICIGKEWHRFPSTYLLPDGVRAQFIKSAFDGLLPGEFREAKHGFGLFPGTWMIPANMNDQNIPDPSKLTDIKRCSYLADFSAPGIAQSPLEPDYASDSQTWEKVHCERFLDASSTPLLGRLLYVPPVLEQVLPLAWRRQWGEYCLLKRRASVSRP